MKETTALVWLVGLILFFFVGLQIIAIMVKLRRRYPQGFSEERSVHRTE